MELRVDVIFWIVYRWNKIKNSSRENILSNTESMSLLPFRLNSQCIKQDTGEL